MNVLYCNKGVYPQIDDPFRCIDIYNRKVLVALWEASKYNCAALSVPQPVTTCCYWEDRTIISKHD